MKIHVGRFAIGGIVITLALVIFWAVETFPLASTIILAVFGVLAGAYLIGAFILAVWDGHDGMGI